VSGRFARAASAGVTAVPSAVGVETVPSAVGVETVTSAGGLVGPVGVERAAVFAVLPIALAAIVVLFRWNVGPAAPTGRTRRLMLAARVLVAVLLVTAAAGPYVVETGQSAGDPAVRLLVDERYTSDANSGIVLPSYYVWNASISTTQGPVTLKLAGTNLTNSLGLTEGNPRTGQQIGQVTNIFQARPILGRRVSLSLLYDF
jgi:hypothetical protein